MKKLLILLVLPYFSIFSQTTEEQKRFLLEFAEDQYKIALEKKQFADSLALANNVPIYKVYDDGSVMELKEYFNGQYIYDLTDNAIAARTISTNKVYADGIGVFRLSGKGQRIGLWEAGGIPRLTHQEYSGRVTIMDGSSTVTQHATHVAGTLIASGVNVSAKGMSYAGTIDGYNSSGDLNEVATAAANGLKVSSHSYGAIVGWRFDYFSDGKWAWFGTPSISQTIDYRFGFYTSESASWDNMLFNAPYVLVTKSAGNDRGEGPNPGTEHWVNTGSWTLSTATREKDGGAQGYDCINDSKGIAKNTLTVGAVNDIENGYGGPQTVVMTSFSNWGPTDDGRIKPDLVANGAGLFSSNNSADNSYVSLSGTSMSTPNVSGSVGLLLELRDSLYGALNPFRASTMKALLLHTADEAGSAPGPDYTFGWGLMNTVSAALMIKLDAELGKYVLIKEDTLTQGNQKTYQFSSNGLEPLKFTMNWTDRPGTPAPISLNPPNKMLVNDLDLRLTGPGGTTYFPWVLNPSSPSSPATTGDNITDNTEQILIANPAPGNYTLTITHKGTLTGGSQIYSLIASGVVVDVPSAPTIVYPSNGTTDVPTYTTFEWTAAHKAVAYEYQIATDANFTNIVSTNTNIREIKTIISNIPGQTSLYWRVRGLNSGGNGDWSNVAQFTTTISPAVTPVVLYPEMNQAHLPTTIAFNWEAQQFVSNYQLQIATNTSFSQLVVSDSAIASPPHTVSGLGDGLRYFWRVRAINQLAVSSYSSTRILFTKINTPDSLKVVNQTDNSVTLTWNDNSSNETKYFILRADGDNDFVKFDSVLANVNTYTDNTISTNVYKYKVYAANNVAVSDTSNTVVINLASNNDIQLPEKFALEQNYPNPFNPNTSIKYSIPEGSYVTLKIFNLLGEHVKTLVNEFNNAGNYSVIWNGTNDNNVQMSSGVYFYELIANNKNNVSRFINKMILAK